MAGQLTIDTLKASSGVLATQNGMTGIAKAWAQVSGSATPTINGSFNVSSITRVSTGVYTVAFTTAMPNINYAVSAATSSSSTNAAYSPMVFTNTQWGTTAPTTGGFTYTTALSTTNVTDAVYSCFVVFSS